MARNTACTIFIGNMDEKVTERVLYEILIQAGNIVDLHIPRDKESNKHKGYAFAEYETEEVANYAVKLFSGLVRLRNKTLRFAMSGQDKPLQKSASPASSHLKSPLMQRPPASPGTLCGGVCSNEDSLASSITRNDATAKYENDPLFHHRNSTARGLSNGSFEYSRRVIGSVINGATHSAVPHNSVAYPFY